MSEIYEEHTETLAVPKFYGQFIRYHSQINKQVPEAAKKLPRWAIFLGAADLYSIDLWAGTFIEFFAMLFLFPIHCNVIVHSVKTYGPSGGDVNLYIGLGHAVLMSIFIISFAAPSGGHLNPLISWATFMTGHSTAIRAAFYTCAQVLGSFLGAQAFNAFSPGNIGIATCSPGILSAKATFLAEVFFSVAMLIPAYGIAFDARQGQLFGPILAPIFIGVMIGFLIWASAGLADGYTGAGFNPVMCWAANQVYGSDSYSRSDNSAWEAPPQWPYWLGPFVGALGHTAVYLLFPPHHKTLYEHERPQTLSNRPVDRR